MIELYFSTKLNINSYYIIHTLAYNQVKCQIYNNLSSTSEFNIENGFYLKIFNVSPELFEEKIWEPLKHDLQLQCAYVISDEYKGCILDWPGVFKKSKCSGRKKKRKRKE